MGVLLCVGSLNDISWKQMMFIIFKVYISTLCYTKCHHLPLAPFHMNLMSTENLKAEMSHDLQSLFSWGETDIQELLQTMLHLYLVGVHRFVMQCL